ncbi:voltage-gated purine nucleotide uniporter SLC17A9 isoform X3 [Lithobates pipiens]
MATKGGKHVYNKSDVDLLLQKDELQSPPRSPQHGDRVKKHSGDQHWSEWEARLWMFTLLAGTCFLYCARSSLPICAVSMSEQFGWNKKQTGLALSSFFWGYCLTQIAGGHLSDKVGGERVLLVSALLWGLITIVTPLAARATTASLYLVSFLRFLMGLLQDQRMFSDLGRGFATSAKTNMPWRLLLKKAPVWAVIIGQVSVASSSFTLFSWVPIFFKNRFPDSKGLVFNVVPWLTAIPAAIMGGHLSDHLIKTGYKPVFVRKLMQVIGMGLSSIFILLLGQSESFCQALIFISVALALQTFNHSGLTINIQELAPSCSGFLFGVANTGGSVFGILWVYLSGYLLDITGSWDSMFHLLVAVNVLGLLIYLAFAKTERMDVENVTPVLKI